jgi:hypothetical protein
MLDYLADNFVLTARDWARSRHMKRVAMAIALALAIIIASAVFGDISWGVVLTALGVAAAFWMLLTIIDKTLNVFARSRES